MRLQISEEQFKRIISKLTNNKISEQEETTGTSDSQSGSQGYPEVGKWETGITRGPANQVGITKWADIVGVNLKRGKANPLK